MESSIRFNETIKTKYIIYGVLLAAALAWPWLIPGEGNGTFVDRISLGMFPALIIGAFIAYKEAKSRTTSYKLGLTVALASACLMVWIIPAVGIFGRSGDPADLIYFGVLAVGITGALLVHFRPRGMAVTLVAMAVVQMLVEVYGLFSGLGSRLMLNGFFAVLWIGSAWLFWYASGRNRIQTGS